MSRLLSSRDSITFNRSIYYCFNVDQAIAWTPERPIWRRRLLMAPCSPNRENQPTHEVVVLPYWHNLSVTHSLTQSAIMSVWADCDNAWSVGAVALCFGFFPLGNTGGHERRYSPPRNIYKKSRGVYFSKPQNYKKIFFLHISPSFYFTLCIITLFYFFIPI